MLLHSVSENLFSQQLRSGGQRYPQLCSVLQYSPKQAQVLRQRNDFQAILDNLESTWELGMIHAEQGERVADFRAVIWLFSLKTSAIIFTIIHWCHRSSCWKAGEVLNDLGRGEYIQVCGTPRAWSCGTRGFIVRGVGESSGTAWTGTFQLLFGREAWACREMWDSGSCFLFSHRQMWQQPGEEKGRGKSCRINASRVLLSWISSSHPWNISGEGLSLIAEHCAESLYY